MNQIQEKVFHLLQVYVEVCDELKLPYFLVCGSALGAVKYGGFIPWDDDIDVGMFREDYEVFCQKAPLLLPQELFLQNYCTDPAFPAIYSKLRDSTTTCVETSVASLPMNHGLCIDIFPLDGYPKERKQQRRLERKKTLFVRLLSVSCLRPERWKDMLVKPLRAVGIGRHSASIADAYTKCISEWSVKNSEIVANHGNWQGKLEYHNKAVYGDGAHAVFEGLPVRIPECFDKYLAQKYGDYRKDPPIEKQKSHHQYLYLDPCNPYTDYLKKG